MTGRRAGLKLSIPAQAFCMSRRADSAFRGTFAGLAARPDDGPRLRRADRHPTHVRPRLRAPRPTAQTPTRAAILMTEYIELEMISTEYVEIDVCRPY